MGVDKDARRAWQAAQVPAREPHPAPEVRARPAQPHEIPAGAKRLAQAAKAAGWNTRADYSRGTTVGAHGRPGKVVDCLVVIGARRDPSVPIAHIAQGLASGGEAFWATWLDGAFESAFLGLHRLGYRELRARLDAPVGGAQ